MIIAFSRPDLQNREILRCFFAIWRWARDNGFDSRIKSITALDVTACQCVIDPPLVDPVLGVFQDKCNRLKSFRLVDGQSEFEYIRGE